MENKKTMEELVNEKVSNLVAELEKLGHPQKVIENMTKSAKKNFIEEFKENARRERNAKKNEDEKVENYIDSEIGKCLDLTKTEDDAIKYAFSNAFFILEQILNFLNPTLMQLFTILFVVLPKR